MTTPANLSLGEQLLFEHYASTNTATRGNLHPETAREFDQQWGDIATEPGGVDYLETEAGGVPAMWLVPRAPAEGQALLCLHGGGFIGGSMYSHRRMFAHIARAAGTRALVPQLQAAAREASPPGRSRRTPRPRTVASSARASSRVAVVGDSAGGGLALGLAITTRSRPPRRSSACRRGRT